MSHSNHEETSSSNQPTNYLFKIILAFVFIISVGTLLRLVIGNQQCKHCSICATCTTCEEENIETSMHQQYWGEESCNGKTCCGEGEEECGEKKAECSAEEKKECCKGEHEKAEVKAEEKTESEEHHH
jgi:hypothetical protein